MPNFTWLNNSIEHSEYDSARCAAIARKITSIQREEESQNFRRMSDIENGYEYDPCEDCECDSCLADGSRNECETVKEQKKLADRKRAESDLELEMLQEKLAQMGARMMRPYEHWNEDERFMEYSENRY